MNINLFGLITKAQSQIILLQIKASAAKPTITYIKTSFIQYITNCDISSHNR